VLEACGFADFEMKRLVGTFSLASFTAALMAHPVLLDIQALVKPAQPLVIRTQVGKHIFCEGSMGCSYLYISKTASAAVNWESCTSNNSHASLMLIAVKRFICRIGAEVWIVLNPNTIYS
jgi:hypothetical protein